MTITPDQLANLRLEYWASLAATQEYQDDYNSSILHLEDAPTFYDFLLTHGFNRYQLSAHGINKDIE